MAYINKMDIKLPKIISDRGICSRREAKDLILKGYVKVNGKLVNEPGLKFSESIKISLLKEAKEILNNKVTILINKPLDYVSSQPSKDETPAIRIIKESNKDPRCKIKLKKEHLKGLAPAGRLDINSTGLLILTQDGALAKKIIGQNSDVEKEYIVQFKGNLTTRNLKKLNHGLMLDKKKLKPAKVKLIGKNKLQFILKEGRNRQIRRMCKLVSLEVTGLKRIRVGSIKLGDLKIGTWMFYSN